jgi:hypothetical protein
MKKVNKILMAVIAILLSLVLISTSVVSGIFARFVIQKSVEAPIIFRKFGVSLKMEVDSDLQSKSTPTWKQLGDSIMVTLDKLTLSPGDDFSDALKFTISGTPNVNVKLKIIVGVEVPSYDHWQIPEGQTFESFTIDSKYFLPVGFTIAANPTTANDKYALKPWYNSNVNTDFGTTSTLKNKIAAGIGDKISGSTVSGNTVSIDFPKATTTSTPTLTIDNTATSQFYLGFEWPMDYTVFDNDGNTLYSSELLDVISVALSKSKYDQTINLTYRVLLEQYQ